MTRTQTSVVVLLLAGSFTKFSAAPALPADGWKQKEFIITFWCPPPATDEALARAAAEGYNLTWVPAEGLDVAARHHLRAMLTSDLLKPEVLEDATKRAELDALIEQVKRHPALEAYFLTDEPGAGAFAGLGKLVAYLRARDPAHLAYINLFPTYANEQQLGVSADAAARARVSYPTNFAGVGTDDQTVLRYREHLKRYIETVKPGLVSYDHYHFLKRSSDGRPNDGNQYFLNIALIRMAAREAGVPFLNIIQAGDLEKAWRFPNADEMRWLVYTTLAYGGRGISYFTYWGAPGGLYVDGKPSPLVKPVAALNAEIAKLGPALMELESLGVYHTTPLPYGTEAVPSGSLVRLTGPGQFVLGLFGKSSAPSAFMIVNRDYEHAAEAMLRVELPGSQLQELDRAMGKWTRSTLLSRDRTMRVQFSPGDGRLFRVTGISRDEVNQRGAYRLMWGGGV
jgi:hypothetical protein